MSNQNKSDTKGEVNQESWFIFAHREVTDILGRESLVRMVQHHMEFREEVDPNCFVSKYDLRHSPGLCVVVSSKDGLLVAVAFEENMTQLLESAMEEFSIAELRGLDSAFKEFALEKVVKH